MCSNVSHRKSKNTTSFSSTPPLVHTPASFSVTIEELNLKEIWQPPYTLLSFSPTLLQPRCCLHFSLMLPNPLGISVYSNYLAAFNKINSHFSKHSTLGLLTHPFLSFLSTILAFLAQTFFFIRFLPLNKYISQFYSQVSFIPVLYVYHVVPPISMTLNITYTLRHNFRNPMLISW